MMDKPKMKSLRRLGLFLGLVVILGVGILLVHGSGDSPTLAGLDGDNQGDTPGEKLSRPLSIRVHLSDGLGARLALVWCTMTPPGGSITPRWRLITTKGETLVNFTVTLPKDQKYANQAARITVHAMNFCGVNSGLTFQASIGDPTMNPAAPGKPVITGEHGALEAEVTWEDNSNNETAFYVERSPNNRDWERIATLPKNTTSFTDNTAIPDKNYMYRIIADNGKVK